MHLMRRCQWYSTGLFFRETSFKTYKQRQDTREYFHVSSHHKKNEAVAFVHVHQMRMFSLLNDLQHQAQLFAGLCESLLLGVRGCLCVCFNSKTKCEEHKQPRITGKHPMTSHINMISSIYTHT